MLFEAHGLCQGNNMNTCDIFQETIFIYVTAT